MSPAPESGGTGVPYLKNEPSDQSSRDVSASQGVQTLDISREYLAAAIAAKRGKTAKDYDEELWYVLKDYAIFHQCFLRKKNVREKNPWKESTEMWNILKPDRYMYVVNVDRMVQRQFAFSRAIGKKGDDDMIVEVERVVEKFDDELREIQPSVDPQTRPSTDSLWMQSEAINISDTEDQSASAGTKRKRDGSPISPSSKPRKAARSSGFALRKPPSPPLRRAHLEAMCQSNNSYVMHSYAPTLSKRSGLDADHGDTIDSLILQMQRFRILRKIIRPEILSLNPIYMIE